MSSTFLIIISLFYLGLIGILINRLHFLSILLCLELLLISIFLGIILYSCNFNTIFIFPNNLILLTLSACEASAGLSLMVILSRTHNSDLVLNINILQH
uniref:NADH-ubiquinone oxidoreductase chain 4L n=1 Tax=Astropecten polyacanthus TaxID=60560 RepID=Q5KSQ4_ASTPO|nr:NADH dehydrogenase subunit 4L [Astropecten polyacanthus]BAD86699.1 NADH dehydrogenase subunit 4L [Astropecten polyacanthus]